MIPHISICIPTFNRAPFLDECLLSISEQFKQQGEFETSVEVVVFDNRSDDNTEEVAQKYAAIHKNIRFIKDDIRRGIAQGIVHAARQAKGSYIWIFSDDDIQKEGAIASVMQAITRHDPDLILCNMDSFINKETVHEKNLLDITNDQVLETRFTFLSFLNTKFPKTIDYYTTFCSNWILKKSVFSLYQNVFELYNSPLDLFPFPSIIFYTASPCKTVIIAERVLLFRADNASWAKKNKFRQFFYHDTLWRRHYRLIVAANKDVLPPYFSLRVAIKNVLRYKELLLLAAVHVCQKLGVYTLVKSIYKKIV